LAQLMRQHDGLVHHVIRRQSGGRLSYAETLHEGRIGLWRAILHFDPGRGTAFSTYAGVAIAHQVWEAVKRRAAQDKEAAETCGLLGDGIQPPVHFPDPLAGVMEPLVKAELHALVAQLDCKQRAIVCAYYGLDDQAAHTQCQLGQRLGCTRQAIHYHLRRALQRLRHPAFSASLRALIDLNRRRDYLQALRPERRRP
jgi:RNA polymerase sigma factor (sigma-70 family)